MRFLILAVSYKYSGLCVAGLDLDTLEYVRIGYPKGDECDSIPSWEFKCRHLSGERQLNILDIIDIDVIKMVNNGCQTENYRLINIKEYLGTATVDDINMIYGNLIKEEFIFLNHYGYVGVDEIDEVGCSLRFVKVDDFTVSKYTNMKGNQRLCASFQYNGKQYKKVRVTDAVFCAYPNCYGNSPKTCIQEQAYIMVSLPYDNWSIDFGRFYKYVSGIILI